MAKAVISLCTGLNDPETVTVTVARGVAAAGERFARLLAAKDHGGLRDLLADPVDFQALTPRRDGLMHAVEQHAYFDSDGARIDWIRILCSGYRPDTGRPPGRSH